MKEKVRDLIEILEIELRQVIQSYLQQKYHSKWPEVLKNILTKEEFEASEKDKFKSNNELIHYTNIGTLRNFICKEWQGFRTFFVGKSKFESKNKFDECIERIIPVRNALYHHRNISEKELKRAEICCEDILDTVSLKWKEFLLKKKRKKWEERRKVILLSLSLLILAIGLSSFLYLRFQALNNIPVIEVLPFKNLKNDTQLDYFGSALAEVIKNKLARCEQLFVIRDTQDISSLRENVLINNAYASEGKGKEIIKKLGVNFLIEGSFIKVGNKLKIMANIINLAKNKVIASTEYESNWSESEILNVHNEIAYKIIEVLNISLPLNQKANIEKVHLFDPEAYKYFSKTWDLFLNGNYQEVILFCKKALEIDPEYLDAYKRLGNTYDTMGDSDSALKSYLEYARISEQKEDKENLANAYINIGWIYQNKGDYQNAVDFYNKGIIQSVEINDKLHEAKAYRQLAGWYTDKGEYDKALTLLLKSSKINRERISIYNHKYNLACDYQEFGILFSYKKEYSKALSYFLKSLNLFKSFGAEKQVKWLTERISDKISDNYTNIGDIAFDQKDYNKALIYYTKGLEIDKLIDWQEGLAGDYRCLGKVSAVMNKNDRALTYFNESLEIFRKNKDEVGLGSVYKELGGFYFKNKEYDKSLSFLNQALLIYKKNNFPEVDEINRVIEKIGDVSWSKRDSVSNDGQ